MNENQNIFGVLSGKESVKVEVNINPQSAIMVAGAVFIALLLAMVIAHRINKNS